MQLIKERTISGKASKVRTKLSSPSNGGHYVSQADSDASVRDGFLTGYLASQNVGRGNLAISKVLETLIYIAQPL
jgi:hypothetical protein